MQRGLSRAAQGPGRTGQVCVAGHDLLDPARSQSDQRMLAEPQAGAIPTMGTERGAPEGLGKGMKQQETQCRARGLTLESQAARSCVTLDK